MTKLLIGLWDLCLAVSPSPDWEERFRPRRLSACIVDRTIMLEACGGLFGLKAQSQQANKNGGRSLRYEFNLTALDALPCRFMLHEVEFDEGNGGIWSYELPCDHELPWPDQHAMSALRPDGLAAMAARELEARARSFTLACPGIRLTAVKDLQVPEWARKALASGQWTAALRAGMEG